MPRVRNYSVIIQEVTVRCAVHAAGAHATVPVAALAARALRKKLLLLVTSHYIL